MVAVMITVEVPVACGGADHRVILNIDGLGRIRCVQADHDQRAESVLEVLGGAPTACCAAKRATTRLRSAVPKAIERARWVRVGVRDLDDLAERIMAFQDRYNATAEPFDWTYTRADLNAFLKRLSVHDPQIRTCEAA